MKAAVARRYGSPDVIAVEDLPPPTPKPDEVRVRVIASSVTRSDTGYRSAEPFFARGFTGIRRPRQPILGSEFSGVIDEVGANVTAFRRGDEVFGMRAGSNAEFVCVREQGAIALKPANLSFAEAAVTCDGAIIALACLRRGGLPARVGQRILIHGASGAIGTAAVQLSAHTFGAAVTAVGPTYALDLIGGLGAERVVDYQREDFTALGETFDVVFDAVGKTSYRRCRHLLARPGTFVETDLGYGWHVPFLALASRLIPKQRVTLPVPKYDAANVSFVLDQVLAGRFRPVIDRTYPLEDIVDATRYVETGQKVGNVVITVAPEPT